MITPDQLLQLMAVNNQGRVYVKDICANRNEDWNLTRITVDGVVDFVKLAEAINMLDGHSNALAIPYVWRNR